jgi:hypothetical protein
MEMIRSSRRPDRAFPARPVLGFARPRDVLKDPDLSLEEKRELLSGWASDRCAVASRPTLRWLEGSPEPVPLLEVMEALRRLDAPALAS